MRLESPAFIHLNPIPLLYSGEGDNISPPLTWSEVPLDCKELALICEDPDAPPRPNKDHPFVHWLVYSISSEEKGLHAQLPTDRVLTDPFHVYQGKNSWGKIGYGGPLPPEGHGVHRYVFTLYALNAELQLDPGLEKKEVFPLIEKHLIKTAKLIGTYERSQKKINAPAENYKTNAPRRSLGEITFHPSRGQ